MKICVGMFQHLHLDLTGPDLHVHVGRAGVVHNNLESPPANVDPAQSLMVPFSSSLSHSYFNAVLLKMKYI